MPTITSNAVAKSRYTDLQTLDKSPFPVPASSATKSIGSNRLPHPGSQATARNRYAVSNILVPGWQVSLRDMRWMV